jgi:hypothetical protein
MVTPGSSSPQFPDWTDEGYEIDQCPATGERGCRDKVRNRNQNCHNGDVQKSTSGKVGDYNVTL